MAIVIQVEAIFQIKVRNNSVASTLLPLLLEQIMAIREQHMTGKIDTLSGNGTKLQSFNPQRLVIFGSKSSCGPNGDFQGIREPRKKGSGKKVQERGSENACPN